MHTIRFYLTTNSRAGHGNMVQGIPVTQAGGNSFLVTGPHHTFIDSRIVKGLTFGDKVECEAYGKSEHGWTIDPSSIRKIGTCWEDQLKGTKQD